MGILAEGIQNFEKLRENNVFFPVYLMAKLT